jgi:tetratricopeptide (TPR) repeat protein
MNVLLDVTSWLLCVAGGIVIGINVYLGLVLFFISLCIFILQLYRKSNSDKELDDFRFATSQALVEIGAKNPLKKQIENELKNKGEISDVQRRYAQILKTDPDDKDAFETILLCYGLSINKKLRDGQGQFDNTFPEIKSFIVEAEKHFTDLSPKGKLSLAILYDGFGQFQRSQEIYSDILLEFPKDTSVMNTYGVSLLMSGKPHEAKKIFLNLLKFEGSPFTLFNLAEAEHSLGNLKASINLHLLCIRVGILARHSIERISESLFFMGHFGGSILFSLIGIFFGNFGLRNIKSFFVGSLLFLGNLINVVLSYTIGRLPFLDFVYCNYIEPMLSTNELIITGLKKFKEPYKYSAQHLKRLVRLSPNNTNYRMNLAIFLAKLGMKHEAVTELDRLLKIRYDKEIFNLREEFVKQPAEELKNIELVF